jgi:hypothetical protein
MNRIARPSESLNIAVSLERVAIHSANDSALRRVPRSCWLKANAPQGQCNAPRPMQRPTSGYPGAMLKILCPPLNAFFAPTSATSLRAWSATHRLGLSARSARETARVRIGIAPGRDPADPLCGDFTNPCQRLPALHVRFVGPKRLVMACSASVRRFLRVSSDIVAFSSTDEIGTSKFNTARLRDTSHPT